MTKVVFTEPASYDLLDIEYYIYTELYNPQAAKRIPFENYNIFYYYNSNQNVVYVIRILYNRVDWKTIL